MSFRTSAALVLTTVVLVVAVATTMATAQIYTVLHNFGGRRGATPTGILVQGRDGNIYATTEGGGTNKLGTVTSITPGGKLRMLYNFDMVHGFDPESGLTLGTNGNFYGTTPLGGASGSGTIFKITKSGSLTTLYSFTGGTDGSYAFAPPVQGTGGNFYGTTRYPIAMAYKITPSGTFTQLDSLPGDSWDPLLLAADGNFYGTSAGPGDSGLGTVFKMTPKGIVSIVYSFDGPHGVLPRGPVIQGSNGNFYGTTWEGGSLNMGVIFNLTPHGAIKVLHNFLDPNYPNDGCLGTGLLQATDGNFYGATYGCGTMGYGVIFKLTPNGDYSILYNFDGSRGSYPKAAPMQHTNGKIYGLVPYGGSYSRGIVYSLDMGLGAFVSLVSTTGKVGMPIEVLGQGFTGTTAVSFNGTAASFSVVSDTYLTTTVPGGATIGFVTVTTPGGTLTSNKQFRVKP